MPLIVSTTPSVKANNLKDFFAEVRKAPTKFTFGTTSLGSASHLAIELLKRDAGLDTLVIPYKGTAPALTDLISGQIQLLADPMLSSLPLARAGKIKALGLTSLKRAAAAPEIPTVEESGMKGFEFVSWYGLWAPRNLPPDVNAFLQKAVAKLRGLGNTWAEAITEVSLGRLAWVRGAPEDALAHFDRATEVAEASGDLFTTAVAGNLRSRLNFQGTTMGFSTERSDFLWWLMISGDVNANRVLLAMLDRESWKEDMPRLARGSLGRQRRGHWNTTVANAWGVLAMEKFAAAFEKETVTGATEAKLGQQGKQVDWSKTPKGDDLMFSWPQGRGRVMVEISARAERHSCPEASRNSCNQPWLPC